MYRKLRFVRYSAIGLGVWGVNPWFQGTYKFANCSIFNFRAGVNQPQSHHLAIRYVDNSFVIVQKHHLQTPVLQVFKDLAFFQASRTRACCADNLLLGLSVDVSGLSLDSGQCFSQNLPITFERTEESSSVNS